MGNLVSHYDRVAPAHDKAPGPPTRPLRETGGPIAADYGQSRKRWCFLGLAVLSQAGVATIRLGISALVPFIKRDLGLSYTEVGFVSSFLNGGAATAGIPAGKVADRLGERLVLGYGSIFSGILVLGIFGVNSYLAILLFLFILGFMTTTLVPAGGKAVAGWFSKTERGTAMGVRQMAVPLGGAVAAMALPSLALAYDWRIALTAAGISSVVIGLIALRYYEEPLAVSPAGHATGNPAIRTLLRRKEIRALLFYAAILSAGQWFYLAYLMLYLTENLHLPIVIGANLLATGQLCGGGGRVLWGVVSDRIFGGRRKPALVLVGGLAVGMSLLFSQLSSQSPLWLVVLSVAFLGVALQGTNGLTHAFASELAGNEMAGLAVGITNSCGFIGVMTLTPVYGFLIDWTGTYIAGWMGVAFLISIAVLRIALIKEEN